MPAGGSLVILVLICSSPSGNSGEGSAVMKRRMSACWLSFILIMMSSILSIRSRPSSQFCSSTHVPLTAAAFMALIATGSWPWPSDTQLTESFFFFASCSIESVGSAPVESRNTTGTWGTMES